MPIQLDPFQRIIYLPLTYSITPDKTTVLEGEVINFSVVANNIEDDTVLEWKIETVSGTIANSDFSSPANAVTVGSLVTIIDQAATFSITVATDAIVEGDEVFKINLYNTDDDIVASTENITITDLTPTYAITTNTQSVTEGLSATITVTTTKIGNKTLYWSVQGVSGTIANSDFTSPTTAVTARQAVTVVNNSATFQITTAADSLVEGPEVFYVALFEATTGPELAKTADITIVDTSVISYAVTPNFTTRNEGDTVIFTVTTQNFGSGTLYWRVSGSVNNSDFSSPTTAVSQGGSVTVTNNSGSFNLVISNDLLTEGVETFTAGLYTGSATGTLVATSATVTINDTSVSPPVYTITPNFSARNEGQTFTFTCYTDAFTNGTLYWTLVSLSGNITNADFSSPANAVTAGGSVTISNNYGQFSLVVSNDNLTEGTESFSAKLRTTSTSGTIRAETTCFIYDTSVPRLTSIPVTQQPDIDFITDLAWNPSGTKIAITYSRNESYDFYAHVYNVSGTSVSVSTIFPYTNGGWTEFTYSRGVAWNPSGTSLAITGGANSLSPYTYTGPFGSPITLPATLEIWNVSGNSYSRVIAQSNSSPPLFSGSLEKSAWASDSKIFCSRGGTARVFNRSGSTISVDAALDSKFPAGPVQSSGGTIYARSSSIVQFNTSSITTTSYVNSSGASDWHVGPAGKVVALVTGSTRRLRAWLGPTTELPAIAEDNGIVFLSLNAVAWNPQGTRVALVGIIGLGNQERLHIYNLSGGTLVRDTSFTGITNIGSSARIVRWSPDGTKIAIGSNIVTVAAVS